MWAISAAGNSLHHRFLAAGDYQVIVALLGSIQRGFGMPLGGTPVTVGWGEQSRGELPRA